MPLYMQVSLNDAVIHLSEHHGDALPGGAIRVKLNDLKNYHAVYYHVKNIHILNLI